MVLQASAKEMKESYFGLYPKENNWYSSKIKPSKENPIYSGKRYMRYIKGDEASYFIQMAHHFEKYNEEIHEWLACRLNNRVKPKTADSIIKHHYYMPTDSSIAIGTFVERPGEVVPLFSNVGKPVYLFKIGEDNWTYNLGGRKGSVCIVPHGWGQQIENIKNIRHEEGKLVFECNDGTDKKYDIISTSRIDDRMNKNIRNYKDAKEFLEKGKNFVTGEIIKTLTPRYLYCQQHIGKVEDL